MDTMNSKNDSPDTPSLDHFFFSCLHYEILVKGKRKSLVTPGMTTYSTSISQLLPLDEDEIHKVIDATSQDNAILKTATQIEYGNLNQFSHALVSLVENIRNSAQEALSKANQKDIQSFCGDLVHRFFTNLDSHSQALVRAYLFWSYKKSDIPEEIVGDRPPVGIFTPSRFPKPSSDSSPRKPSGNHDRGKRTERSGRVQRGGGREQRGGRRHETRGENRKEISEADLLKEIIKATSDLNANSDLDRVALKPQNSFNRRRQHQLISDEGFSSESEGDKDHRHVVILRS